MLDYSFFYDVIEQMLNDCSLAVVRESSTHRVHQDASDVRAIVFKIMRHKEIDTDELDTEKKNKVVEHCKKKSINSNSESSRRRTAGNDERIREFYKV